jgi:ABC-type polysaccharide/polyol phosphate transport system ATPase subunit
VSGDTTRGLAIDVRRVSKTFAIPRVRRDTVREHAFDLFRRRGVDRLRVLENVSFSVARGESVGLMGRNGSGKSTLLKLIAGIYQPDRGDVAIDGEITPILELGVGFHPELDAVDNVYLLGTVMGLSVREVRARLDGILRFAELERFARLKLQHFSSGMVARLAYAVAFNAVTDILLLDEIFAVGDAGFKARCEERYRQLLAAGHTVVLVSHDPTTIADLCSRAVLLENGEVIASGPASDVAQQYLALLASGDEGPESVPAFTVSVGPSRTDAPSAGSPIERLVAPDGAIGGTDHLSAVPMVEEPRTVTPARRNRRHTGPVPRGLVLLYHRIGLSTVDPWSVSVSPTRFTEHMEVLAREFMPTTLADMTRTADAGDALRVAVTFDDGYVDALEIAAPVLHRHGIPATFLS